MKPKPIRAEVITYDDPGQGYLKAMCLLATPGVVPADTRPAESRRRERIVKAEVKRQHIRRQRRAV